MKRINGRIINEIRKQRDKKNLEKEERSLLNVRYWLRFQPVDATSNL
jgi:hypothetical protein